MEINLFTIFKDGGPFMWPILILSICAVALIIERTVSHILFFIKSEKFLGYLVSGGNAQDPGFKGIEKSMFSHTPEKIGKTIQEITQISFDKMLKIIELLSGIGNLAPLLGFIGTVSGMIFAFQSIAESDKVTVKLVAGGISQALITTGFGLAVAIICIFAEQIFRFNLVSRAHRIEEEVNQFVRKKENLEDKS